MTNSSNIHSSFEEEFSGVVIRKASNSNNLGKRGSSRKKVVKKSKYSALENFFNFRGAKKMGSDTILLTEFSAIRYIADNLLIENFCLNFETFQENLDINTTKNHIVDFITKHLPELKVYTLDSERVLFLKKNGNANEFIKVEAYSKELINVEIFGSLEFVKNCKELLENAKTITKSFVKWYYQDEGRLGEFVFELNERNLPVDEMYPWLKVPLTEYYDSFLNSSENILLLIGPPGTGKTTFIRGLIKHANTMASICYDEAVLSMDDLFISFFNNDESNVLLIEDADTHIKSRESGNELMKRFLNVADGICANFGKKIVFTTNLPNVREVDSALIRPGRCFDVLQFRKLEVEELNKLAKKLNIDKEVSTSMTLAEFFSYVNDTRERSTIDNKFGFA